MIKRFFKIIFGYPLLKEGDVFGTSHNKYEEEWERNPLLYKVLKVGKRKYLILCINDRLAGNGKPEAHKFGYIDPYAFKITSEVKPDEC